ncbi:unnamed protein product [Ectocarpus sp. 13 AM-2016]
MPSEDRAALVALFRSTGGTRWIRNANWDTDADLSQWSRVKVNNDGRVVKLSLANNYLGGTIPEALGALTELKELDLFNNKLTGPIPEAFGALKDLEILTLIGNKLTGEKTCVCKDDIIHFMNKLHRSNLFHVLNACTGSIPPWLGSLKKLQQLGLNGNELAGPIPETLGALTELTGLLLSYNKLTGPIPEALGALKGASYLWFDHNKLTDSIPKWLGSLSMLRGLRLNDNQLVGPIPEALGALKGVTYLWFDHNKLTGHIPKELGNLTNLRELHVHHNRLTGTGIPTELGNLSALSTFEFGNTRSKSLFRRGNKLAGGPAKGEGLDSWRARMRLEQRTKPQALKGDKKEEDAPAPPTSSAPVLPPQQETNEGPKERGGTGEGDEKEEDAPVPPGSRNQREEVVAERTISLERFSLSPEQAKMDRLFRAQLSSSAGFDSLIRENPEALADIQRVIEAQAAGRFPPVDELSDMERHRKLGTLVAMSTALGEVALRHTEDMDTRRKELALPLFSKAYYTAARSGVCNAYLAASIFNSDWVSTSKTCGVGKAGVALKLMSSAVPVVGGLTGLAGKALETGDHYLQTRRLVKITAMAPDTVECCTLARSLALHLADGLRNDAGATADDADEVRVLTTAGMIGSGCGRGADMMPGDMSEEDVFEYLA